MQKFKAFIQLFVTPPYGFYDSPFLSMKHKKPIAILINQQGMIVSVTDKIETIQQLRDAFNR